MAQRLKVALLYGGRSSEHAVSLRSADSVSAALAARYDVVLVYVDRQGRWSLQDSPGAPSSGGQAVYLVPGPDGGRLRAMDDASVVCRPDVYFPLFHGTFGEDGTIQGLLELADVPYVGSGVTASALGMDKQLSKSVFAQAGLPLGPYRALRWHDPEEEAVILDALGLPLFVKPANLGSSVGISKVKTPDAFAAALDIAFKYDKKVVVEAAINAREIEVSVLGDEEPAAALPGEVVPDREFYDYESKYSDDSRTQLLIPAALCSRHAEEARALAVRAFRAVDAAGYARVDLFLDRGSGRLLVNEINTIPGFTSISMFPKLWEAAGLAYVDLLDRLIDLGRNRHDDQRRRLSCHHP
ncbi:MAG: D-alanine--D-alanine ligase [Vicinamibacteria bacterium]|nr:D-alanine--D-alanine ligase [Vicinamibacteria bacterium]